MLQKKTSLNLKWVELTAIATGWQKQYNQLNLQVVTHMNTFEIIYDVVKQIPYGKVATYGQVAALVGNKRLARVVGYALHANPEPDIIPCYRVVNRHGKPSKAFAFGGEEGQIALLKEEGIVFRDGKVDLSEYQWKPKSR